MTSLPTWLSRVLSQFFFVVGLLGLASPAWALSPLEAVGTAIKDQTGATILLRGVNVAGNSKVPPFKAFAPEDLERLPGLGINAIRLLFNWEAFEGSAPGVYDYDYLRWYESVVDKAGELGIYVIIDLHQDLFSRYLAQGCGEGFPRWAIPAGMRTYAPDNGVACAAWFKSVVSDKDVHAAFQNLYTRGTLANLRFVELWKILAATFRDRAHVAGYELINEPVARNGNDDLFPFYVQVVNALRRIDARKMLFLEPPIFRTGLGENSRPLRKPAVTNMVYAPHHYDMVTMLLKQRNLGDTNRILDKLKEHADIAKAWGVPMLLGEFGLPGELRDPGPVIDAFYRGLDQHLASGAQWNYTPGWTPGALDGWNAENLSITDNTGSVRPLFRVRPTVQRVAGTLLGLEETRRGDQLLAYRVRLRHNPALGTTDIFVPDTDGGWNVAALGLGVSCRAASATLVRCQGPLPVEATLVLTPK